ncbi:hypothetical protein ACJJIF_10755 [Microbulbifer sp. SSSA002]|uniref:hypothetical protein n=1 Tax=Microbulbifer sp. SSSA002 TaxID=3243376 RepID=UPI00403957B1
MSWFRRQDSKKNSDYLLEGLLAGMAASLGSSLLVIGALGGWLGFISFVALCTATYWCAKIFIYKKKLLSGIGRSEFWWLGFFAGGIIFMGYGFAALGVVNA